MGELKLSQIWIYPIKSMAGIPLSEAKVMRKGLQYDRRWMLVDNEGIFITQRVHTILALFKITLDATSMTVSFKGDHISVGLNDPIPGELESFRIWDDTVEAFEVNKLHSQWFSDRIGMVCRLVAFPEDNPRQVDPEYVKVGENVSLADAYPFLIIGQASLDDLNERLAQPITIKRFRPNLVFTGGQPYEEDTWKEFLIGDTTFEGVKPCARCVLTTVDPESGEKGVEPLRTLSTYRRRTNKIYFGQNVLARDLQVIRIGEIIVIKNSQVLGDGILKMGFENRT